MWPPHVTPRFSSLLLWVSLSLCHPPAVQARGLGCSPPHTCSIPSARPVGSTCVTLSTSHILNSPALLAAWPPEGPSTHTRILAQSLSRPRVFPTHGGQFYVSTSVGHLLQLFSQTPTSALQQGCFTDVSKAHGQLALMRDTALDNLGVCGGVDETGGRRCRRHRP